MSIRIHVTKATGDHDPGCSKFFGAPTVPEGWADRYEEDIIFLGQIRLSDIAHLDTENKLPHTGYLYFFVDTELYPYFPMCEYYDGEPNILIEDFNELDPAFAHLTEEWLMTFSEDDDVPSGFRLLGEPAGEVDHEGDLLLQYDPLEAPMGFLDSVDGYVYFFFGKQKKNAPTNWNNIQMVIDRS